MLEREINIPAEAKIQHNEKGYEVKYHSDTVSVFIGIGNNSMAELIMCVEDWEDFKNGEKIKIEIVK